MHIKTFATVSSLLVIALASSEGQNTLYSDFAGISNTQYRSFSPSDNANITEQRKARTLSHIVGVWQKPSSPILFGPDIGAATTPPDTVRISPYSPYS